MPKLPSDLIDSSAETPTPVELPKTDEAKPEAKPDPQKEAQIKTLIDKENRRLEQRSGIESFLRIKQTGVLSDEEIVNCTKGWAEGVDLSEKNLSETLKYFEMVEPILYGNFSPEEKVEVTCALAELVANGTLDAETLQALAFRIVRRESGGGVDKVCEYDKNYPVIIIYDELFQKVDGVPQNIVHILKHEIAHGLSRNGVGQSGEMRAKIGGLVTDGGDLSLRESYRSVNALNQYSAAISRPEATDEDKAEKMVWLSEEILAEKIAAYLQSGGEFNGFLNSIWRVMPAENQRNLMKNKSALNAWIEESHFFFDQIKSQMANKTALKERVLISTATATTNLSARDSDDENNWDSLLQDGIGEPAMPDNSKSTDGNGESLWGILNSIVDIYKAADPEIAAVSPVEAINKAA